MRKLIRVSGVDGRLRIASSNCQVLLIQAFQTRQLPQNNLQPTHTGSHDNSAGIVLAKDLPTQQRFHSDIHMQQSVFLSVNSLCQTSSDEIKLRTLDYIAANIRGKRQNVIAVARD